MPVSESRRQEIEKQLAEIYNIRAETERLLTATTNPTDYAQLQIQLEKAVANIKSLESELEEQPFGDDNSLIRAYLDEMAKEFETYSIAHPIKLTTQTESTSATERLGTRRDLQKMEAFLISEETKLLSVRKQQQPATPPAPKEVGIEEFLVQNRRILLLGGPGTGKTVMLWRLFQVFSQSWKASAGYDVIGIGQPAGLPPQWQGRIPMLVHLNRWEDDEMGLLAFLQAQVSAMNLPEFAELIPDLMKSGKIVLLLDGLDELPGLARDAKNVAIDDPRARSISSLDERWREVACILTCRARDSMGAPRWPSLSLAEMSREQVKAFASAYYANDPKGEALTQGLVAGIYDNPDPRYQQLQGLTARPLYLVKLLDYYQVQKSNEATDQEALPINPARLLKFCLNETLTREIQDKRLSETEASELHDHLSSLAFCMTAANQVGTVDKNRATAWIFHIQEKWSDGVKATTIEEKTKAARFWQLAEGASLMVENGNNLQFYCQILQEYFCASYCATQSLSEEFLEWTTQPSFKTVWPYWSRLDKTLRDKLIAFLDEKYSGKVCWDASTALINIGDDKVIYLLGNLLSSQSSQVRSRGITALGRMANPAAVSLLIKGLGDENASVRASAATALSQFGEPALRPLMTALRDPDPGVRYSAATALGKLGDTRALNALNWLLQDQTDQSPFAVRVRQAATNAIELIRQKVAS